jgi:SAM-dependent methyltransferase
MSNVRSYFDSNAHRRYYNNIQSSQKIYRTIINNIQKTQTGKRIKLLDLGCGDGTFIKGAIMTEEIDATFIGTDLSPSMASLAKNNLRHQRVEIFVADAFKLPLISETKFDVIHMAYVLHHLTGNTRAESRRQQNSMIKLLVDRLSENGILLIEEIYYISHILPHLTSFMVFYGLKLLNFLHLDASRIIDEYVPGLEVNFLSLDELKKLLEPHGHNVQLIRKEAERVPKLKRLFLLKEMGYMSYVCL